MNKYHGWGFYVRLYLANISPRGRFGISLPMASSQDWFRLVSELSSSEPDDGSEEERVAEAELAVIQREAKHTNTEFSFLLGPALDPIFLHLILVRPGRNYAADMRIDSGMSGDPRSTLGRVSPFPARNVSLATLYVIANNYLRGLGWLTAMEDLVLRLVLDAEQPALPDTNEQSLLTMGVVEGDTIFAFPQRWVDPEKAPLSRPFFDASIPREVIDLV